MTSGGEVKIVLRKFIETNSKNENQVKIIPDYLLRAL